jgi:hypothetical protein
MIDFYYHLRQKMITRMQTSLKQIRQVLGFGVQEFSELIGLTRQTINNLETKKNKMSSTQYIAICALIDNYTKDKSELLSAILNILASNDEEYINDSLDNDVNKSFLKEWFLSFPDNSKILNFSIDEISTIEDKYFNEIAENYKIFLDNTILLEESFQNKVQTFAKAMEENNNKFIVPFKVIEDIQRQILASNKNITRGINILEELQNKNLIDIRGEVTDIDINSTFLSVFAKFKSLYRLALITNNLNLASQISVLNNENIKGFNILLLKYEKNIGIKKWEEFTDIQSITSEAKKNINENFIGWETIN